MSPEQAETIQRYLNIKIEDIPVEKRELYKAMSPFMEEFLLDCLEINVEL